MVEDRQDGTSRGAPVGAHPRGSRRARRSAFVLASVLAAVALFSGCTKTSSVSAGATPTNPAPVAAPMAKKTCAEHLAAADPARQTEVGDEVASLGLPSVAPDLNTKVDTACRSNPESSFASVVRGLACSKATASPSPAPPASAPGAPRIDPRPTGLAVGHPARAGGGRGGGRSGSGSSGGSKSGGGSSSGSSNSGSNSGSSSNGSNSGSSSNGSSSSNSGSSGPVNACG